MPFRLRCTLLHTTQCTLRRAANTSLPAEFSIVDGNWLLWTIAVNVHNREGFKEKVGFLQKKFLRVKRPDRDDPNPAF